MATQIRFRRGTTAQHATFTGASGEVTVDTDKKTVVVHDGVTPGGSPLVTGAANIPNDNSVSTVKIQDNAVTNAKMADNSVNTAEIVNGALSADTTGRAKMSDSFITTPKLIDGVLSADVTGRAKMANGFVTKEKLAPTVRFSANKNNVDQTGVGTTVTKLTFTTETEDVGGYYDAANSRFTPLVAGTYQITCAVFAAGTVTDASLSQILIYKNGSLFFGGYTRASGTTSVGASVVKQVPMNGTTDFIEIYYRHGAAGGTVLGDTASTIFEGFLL